MTDRIPLVVDVDGTLLKGDLLHEAALQFVARHPFQSWRLGSWLTGGKAHLKTELAARVDPVVESIPMRDAVVDTIAAAKADGREVWLASASPRPWVERVAARIDGIDGVLATDARTNLAGANKAAALAERFGEGGFDYVGDNRVDMPVWQAARRPLMVAHQAGLERSATRAFPEMTVVARERRRPRPYVRALRPYQWAKNLLVFLPIIAGHHFLDPRALFAAVAAFLAFSLAASSTYIVNDLLDLPGDRDHPRKRNRPFAAAQIPAVHGLLLSAALMLAAVALAVLVPWRFAAVLGGYVALTLAYSLVLKRRMLIDVIVLAGLYAIRVLGGVVATGEQMSPWLLMFSLFLFLSLAAVKRCSELVARRAAGKSAPPGRGYRLEDLNVLFPLAAAAGYGAVLVVTLYLSSPEVTELYAHPTRMWLICPLLLYWISRVLMISNRNELHDDPVIFALTDRMSWLIGVLVAGVIAVSI
jgi:4-hydroxybenzoate polyprenyltransferase/phosphoserine phosphatase